jgi:exosome complex component CSL4
MLCLPGDSLGKASDGLVSGVGTYVSSDGTVRASLSGSCVVDPASGAVCVASSVRASTATSLVPEVGQMVLARVLRISPLLAHCELLLCEGKPTAPYSGVVRREHVREGEVDAVKMEECFLPGDIVHAMVASLGDSRSFFLSTQGAQCGVVSAKAEVSGLPLRAVSATEMEDATSGARERRKVALLRAAAPQAAAAGSAPPQ